MKNPEKNPAETNTAGFFRILATPKKLWDKNKSNIIEWGIGWAACLSAIKTLETNQSLLFPTICSMAASLIWKPAISLASSTTALLLIANPNQTTQNTTPILLAWAAWTITILIRKEPTGLEGSPSAIFLALAALWTATSTSQNPGNTAEGTTSAILLSLALLCAGQHSRIPIAIICLLTALSPNNKNLHKNAQGKLMTCATTCLLITPGPIGKTLALIPTHKTFTDPKISKSAATKITITAVWLAWLAALALQNTPKKHRKKTAITLAILATSTLATSPIWTPLLIKALNKSTSLTGRIPLWKNLEEWIQYQSWDGYPSFWPHQGNQTSFLHNLWPAGSAHNTPLEIWIAFGFGGLLLATAAAMSATFHKQNSPKSSFPAAASWIHTLVESFPTNQGNGTILANTTAFAQGDSTPKPSKEPNKTTTITLITLSTTWAAASLALLPTHTTKIEELWIGQSTTTELITGKNKTQHVQNLKKDIQSLFPNLCAFHTYKSLTLTIQADSTQELDKAENILQKSHTFLRTTPIKKIIPLHRKNLVIALLPATLAAPLLLKNRKRTTTCLLIAATAAILNTKNPKETNKENTHTIPTSLWTDDQTFPKFWKLALEENLQGELLSRILSTPEQTVLFKTQTNTNNKRSIQIKKNQQWKDHEIQEALFQTEKILETYRNLPQKPPKDTPTEH